MKAIVALTCLLAPLVWSQQFAILPPPATPTSIDLQHGPPPDPVDVATAQLPDPPKIPLGSEVFDITDGPPEEGFMSIGVPSNLLGISIELSIADDFLGNKLGEPSYQLLNYLTTLSAHMGESVVLRIGGNTQDSAIYNETFTGVIAKTGGGMSNGVPVTPKVIYGSVVFELIQQVAQIVDAKIVWGVNMVDVTAEFTVPMINRIRKTLDDRILFYLVGNEPDRYAGTNDRPQNYSIDQYIAEWRQITDSIISADYHDNPKQFAAPSVCCYWSTKQVLDSGFLGNFSGRLNTVAAIRYPQSRCQNYATYGAWGYLWQPNIVQFGRYNEDAVQTAVWNKIPYYLVESNTASCVGIVDVSDTFVAAIWAVNAGMQFAYRNHTGILMHNGGQSTLYNLFTPPAFNSSNRIVTAKAWRTGPVIYALLVVGEALRPMNPDKRVTVTDQEIGSNYSAAYNVYEDGYVTKRVFINMVHDPAAPASRSNDLRVQFGQPGFKPPTVPYKLLAATDLTERDNITWAGQTFGYYSEGILKGQEKILQAPCANGKCTLSIPPATVALVFVAVPPTTSQEPGFPSVTSSAFHPVGTNNPQIVLQSNGDRGRRLGATSRRSAQSGAVRTCDPDRMVALLAAVLAIVLFCVL